jgi:hypothetical protein
MMIRRSLLWVGLVWFTQAALAGVPPAEQARIDRLIGLVGSQSDAQFIRNGAAYSCKDAARFLRGKLDKIGEHVSTAQQFIEQIASKSSTSGQAYLIRFADGRVVTAAAFLGDELRRMDAAH